MGGQQAQTSLWTDQIIQETPATKYLCAGAYVDRAFRTMVIRDVYAEPRRRVAPSYGFDLVAVVAHARRAWAMETAHQISVLAVLGTGAVTNPAAAVLAICILIALPLTARIVRTTPILLWHKSKSWWSRWLRGRESKEGGALREQGRLLMLSSLGLVLLGIIPIVVARLLSTPLGAATTAAAAMLLMIALFSVVVNGIRQWAVNNLRRTSTLRPSSLNARMRVIDTQQSHPLVVYSHVPPDGRDPSPFFGSGRLQGSLQPESIRLLRETPDGKPSEEFDAAPFEMRELIAFMKAQIAKLGNPMDSTGLPRFYIRDRLFTDEVHALSVRDLLRGGEPDPVDIDRITRDPLGHTQHYLEIGTSLTGDVVTTVFARFTIVASSLALDIALGALTPIPDYYKRVDAFKENGIGAVARETLRGLITFPRDAAEVWRLGQVPYLLTRAVLARHDQTLTPRRAMVIGTTLSIRERASAPWRAPESALSRPIVKRHKDLILRRLLDVTISFLETKKIDVSDFKKQINTIINANVYNKDGVVSFSESAIGEGATVNKGDAGSGSTGGQDK